jgi:uncharacterized protein YbaR (Trm112 family)
MPIQFKPKSSKQEEERTSAERSLLLFTESGELTLAGQTIADFLETVDFEDVTTSPEAEAFLFNPDVTADDPYADLAEEGDEEDGDEEKVAADADDEEEDDEEEEDDDEDADESAPQVVLPGEVAARLADMDDLSEMFGFYLDKLGEKDELTLSEKATLAVFADYRDDEGGLTDEGKLAVAKHLAAVLSEGMLVEDAEFIDEKFLSKGQRMKRARIARKPKAGKKRMELKKRRKKRKRMKAKVLRQERKFRRKRKTRLKMLSRERSSHEGSGENGKAEGVMIFGHATGIDGADFRASLAETPDLEFTRDDLIALDAQMGNVVECPECEASSPFTALLAVDEKKKKMPPAFLKNIKGKKGKKDADGDNDGSEKGEKDEAADEAVSLTCPKCEHEFPVDEAREKLKGAKYNHPAAKSARASEALAKETSKEKAAAKKTGSNESAGGPFSIVSGRPDLSEGHSLAARSLGAMGRLKPKPLTEAAD